MTCVDRHFKEVLASEKQQGLAGSYLAVHGTDRAQDCIADVALDRTSITAAGEEVAWYVGDAVAEVINVHNPASNALIVVDRQRPKERSQRLYR